MHCTRADARRASSLPINDTLAGQGTRTGARVARRSTAGRHRLRALRAWQEQLGADRGPVPGRPAT
eukprot:476874-Alexandrium_andersonii.AAC.1